jgi:hypothetical protein
MTKQELLDWAEAYYAASLSESELHRVLAPGTFERRMWICLFNWAGWE